MKPVAEYFTWAKEIESRLNLDGRDIYFCHCLLEQNFHFIFYPLSTNQQPPCTSDGKRLKTPDSSLFRGNKKCSVRELYLVGSWVLIDEALPFIIWLPLVTGVQNEGKIKEKKKKKFQTTFLWSFCFTHIKLVKILLVLFSPPTFSAPFF